MIIIFLTVCPKKCQTLNLLRLHFKLKPLYITIFGHTVSDSLLHSLIESSFYYFYEQVSSMTYEYGHDNRSWAILDLWHFCKFCLFWKFKVMQQGKTWSKMSSTTKIARDILTNSNSWKWEHSHGYLAPKNIFFPYKAM